MRKLESRQHDDDDDDDDDEIAYFTVRWKTRASFVYRTKNMK